MQICALQLLFGFTTHLTFILMCRLNSCSILLLYYIDMSTEQPHANSSIEVICEEHELKEQGN